jgi:hypothetical protein
MLEKPHPSTRLTLLVGGGRLTCRQVEMRSLPWAEGVRESIQVCAAHITLGDQSS